MIVEDVTVIQGHITVSGKCKNKKYFTSKLVDDSGTEYIAFLPFIKHVTTPEMDYITLELQGVTMPSVLMGKTLRSLPQ